MPETVIVRVEPGSGLVDPCAAGFAGKPAAWAGELVHNTDPSKATAMAELINTRWIFIFSPYLLNFLYPKRITSQICSPYGLFGYG